MNAKPKAAGSALPSNKWEHSSQGQLACKRFKDAWLIVFVFRRKMCWLDLLWCDNYLKIQSSHTQGFIFTKRLVNLDEIFLDQESEVIEVSPCK